MLWVNVSVVQGRAPEDGVVGAAGLPGSGKGAAAKNQGGWTVGTDSAFGEGVESDARRPGGRELGTD